ncbi:hypothetical protein KQ51_01326 [Candidatus Izimaplasma bacterium HR1]|jgi:hypothetical protein|uniref:hypothetical protein n=1 Tax=Candidatus Izimoplasma sp. HR1 TaxID=1541959 RepID=UPI0004F8E853|nr:hypothetical protein KQ51_01326 [Candidatus Izimaplasma bacterium HR1]
MAILGIIGVIAIFGLFSISFIQFRGENKFTKENWKNYYELDELEGEVEVTKKQEEIYNYMINSRKATFEQLRYACDCKKSDIDEMVKMGILKFNEAKDVKPRMNSYVKGIISVIIIGLMFYFANYYILIRFNFRYTGIIIYLTAFIIYALIYFGKFNGKLKKKLNNGIFIVVGVVAFTLLFYTALGGRTYFHAEAYSNLIDINEDEFGVDVGTVDVDTLPIVDKQYGEKLGSLKLGEYPGIGSEFETGAYSDIIYQGEQYLVSPLEYRGIFKWFNNKATGTPGYIMINKVTAETTLVNITETDGTGMKYTPSAFFDQDLVRYAYMNGMSKYRYEGQFFEIDDSGNPYYILQYSLPTIFINGGRDVAKTAVVNAITGDIKIYDPDKVPSWVESVYPSNLLLTQLNYWGSLQDGWINSIFGQRGVLQPSNGKRTIMNDGELYYFTGLTSAGSDESTIGFVYMNTRTKETKLYKFPGATEQAAMNKVLTLLPQNNISTSFPIPINVNDTPTYFIAIKGEDGRILRYVFMSVKELELYGIEETKSRAYTLYLQSLGSANTDDLNEITGMITEITSYVLDGNTIYWIQLDDDERYMINVASFESDVMMYFIGLDIGDSITMSFQENTVFQITIE